MLWCVWVYIKGERLWKLTRADANYGRMVRLYFNALTLGFNARVGMIEPAWSTEEILRREG